ncbi:phosphoribosyltransferase-like protein [Niabella hibiscisoli]|uniref:phosphoribosyltransferase-like protein n=1 Tax=Niabella hibiscisoli TaxID=1825928 RepID=UPI001F0DC663|nr:hypothetical protein [Niabella hibiscisoli]MCH5717777.1 hypothetical protein [Niabella hibiscisoli]
MRSDIAISLLSSVISEITDEDEQAELIKYFQTMATYKYDDYQQYDTGQRFIENLAIWLNQFTPDDRKVVLKFLRSELLFISITEINLLAEACFPDTIRQILTDYASIGLKIPKYRVQKIIDSPEYRILLRQCLFCGLSDGARLDIFRRANTGVLSHEQIYLTYELSDEKLLKMRDELVEDLEKPHNFNRKVTDDEGKFKKLFLIDDFSASGTSYLKYNEKAGKLKGKIASLYSSIFPQAAEPSSEEANAPQSAVAKSFSKDLKIYIILYLCTSQAKKTIEDNFEKLHEIYGHKPQLVILHEIHENYKITETHEIHSICKKDIYYDKDLIEDKHTNGDVKLGFGHCALPLILAHNTPNNTIPLLWSYEYSTIFKGLFPRIPRHRVL